MPETFNSYYFSLESTGNKEVDTILSSVAFAGSMCHDTVDWTEDDHGGSVADGIQEAANLAAKTINTQVCDYAHEIDDLQAQVKELKEKLSEGKSLIETVVRASGKKDQTHALGVHLDDTGVAFLTASFLKRCRDWLATPPSTQEGEE